MDGAADATSLVFSSQNALTEWAAAEIIKVKGTKRNGWKARNLENHVSSFDAAGCILF